MLRSGSEHVECLITNWTKKVTDAIGKTKDLIGPLQDSKGFHAFAKHKDASQMIKTAEEMANASNHLASYLKACPQKSTKQLQEDLEAGKTHHKKLLAVICDFVCWQLVERPNFTNPAKGRLLREKAGSFLQQASTEEYRSHVSCHVEAAIADAEKKCKDQTRLMFLCMCTYVHVMTGYAVYDI